MLATFASSMPETQFPGPVCDCSEEIGVWRVAVGKLHGVPRFSDCFDLILVQLNKRHWTV